MFIKNLDYYEYNAHLHPYWEGEHHFVFDMKFVCNHDHMVYEDPPGYSIDDQFDQVFYYTHFLICDRLPELIPVMI